jgi:hypothetical protein
MILSVLWLVIALLLFPISFTRGWEINTIANAAIADSVFAKPFMTGVRITSWDGQQQLFVLQIESLELILKTLGPFQLEDYRDIAANNCYLRSDSASLAGNLKEIEKLLVPMMKSIEDPISKSLSASPPKLEAKPGADTEKLVGFPPTLLARPFACAISQPQGIEIVFRADLATFDPTQTDIPLEGNVKVEGPNQTRLTAENIIWRVTPQELIVEGAYRFHTGEREIVGRDDRFSLADGGLEPVKGAKNQTLTHLRELPSSTPTAPLTIAESSKGVRPRLRKKDILGHLSRTLLQIMGPTVAPMNQQLTASEIQGKEAAFRYPKPIVYPLSPMAYSLEETVNRELFSEKCR